MTNWVFPSSFPFAYGRFFVELCWFLNFVLCSFLFCGEMGGLLQGVHWYKIWNSSQISSKSGLSSLFGWKFTLFFSHTMNFDIKFQPYENVFFFFFQFWILWLLLISLPDCIMVHHSSNGQSALVIISPPPYP